ncbi:MAG: leucine-rich repeat domain-containing protein [Muribaculaceae bacterium]|nr:leucine-rich repeat domain-containing protein [Muribaculaceae bacterium]
MKQVFRQLLALVLLCTASPWLRAQDGETTIKYYYEYDEDAYIARVVGNGDIVVPAQYNGSPVRYFGGVVSEGATSVTLPASIVDIKDPSYSNGAAIKAPALKTLDMSATSMTSIEDLDFDDCTSLSTLLFPQTMKDISSMRWGDGFPSLKKLSIPPLVDYVDVSVTALEELILEDGINEIYLSISMSSLKKFHIGRNGDSRSANWNFMTKLSEKCTKLEEVTIGETVTYIPERAFNQMTTLKKVELPSSLTYIGDEAFCGVPSLRKLNLGDVDYLGFGAFGGCSDLESVSFNGEIKSIGSSCFSGCTKLNKVTFFDKSTVLSDYMFAGCSALTSIDLPASLAELPDGVFYGTGLTDIRIPENVKSVGSYAFDQTAISKLTIPGAVEFLGDHTLDCDLVVEAGSEPMEIGTMNFGSKTVSLHRSVFGRFGRITAADLKIYEGCDELGTWGYNLENVYAPSLAHWASMKFKNYTNNPLSDGNTYLIVDGAKVSRPVLPAGIKRLNDYVFYGYKPLVTITFPEGFESIGNNVFGSCTGLQRLIFPSLKDYLNVTPDTNRAWVWTATNQRPDEYLERYIGSQKLSTMASVDIPEGVTAIPRTAFINCKSIQNITIPSTVVSIGESAFDGTEGLTSVGTLPDGITKIGVGAFRNSGIKSLNIPKGVKYIEGSVCNECRSLASVKFHDDIDSIGGNAFHNVPFHDKGDYSTDFVDIYLPRKLKSIGKSAFAYTNSNISRRYHIYPALEKIGVFADRYEKGYGDVYIEDLKAWSHIEFENFDANPAKDHHIYLNGERLTQINIPDDWEYISDAAFYCCSSPRTVRLGNIKAGNNTFWNCPITDVCVANTELGTYTFPSRVKNIYSLCSEPPLAEANSFYTFDDTATLYVPAGSRAEYETSMPCWWQFINIEESDFAGLDAIFGAQSGVESVAIPERVWTVSSRGGRIIIDGAPADATAQVYTMAGTMLYSGSASSAVDAVPGMYVVRLSDGTSAKVCVK